MSYYSENLSARRLLRVYQIATPRIKQYLQAELDHVLSLINQGDTVLDLGCGYGRIIPDLAKKAGYVVGIDSSAANLHMGKDFLSNICNQTLACMDAACLGLSSEVYNSAICIQNGISAFHVDQTQLIREALRVVRPGGKALFSTYSSKIWDARLEWFELQAAEGLLGEIDYSKTGDGVIVCKDGFTATAISPEEFKNLTSGKGDTRIVEVDESSLFCEIRK